LLSSAAWHGVICQAVLQFPCHLAVLFHEHVNFQLTTFSCGASWSTTAWLMGDVCVSIFKVFHSSSDSIGSHSQGIQSLHVSKKSISLTAILSQWNVRTLVVLMCQPCIHIQKDTSCYQYHNLFYYIYSTGV